MSHRPVDSQKPIEDSTYPKAVERIIHPHEKNLGEFTVRRSLPSVQQKMVGPWIFFDHMGPATFAAGSGVNVRPHPHINLATVTYLFEGEILHRDSLGSVAAIRPGDINLMVAGSGIVHSERERPEHKAQAHGLHGLQLWLALPEEFEEIDPAFYHYPANSIPTTKINNVAIRVLMGQVFGLKSPVMTYAGTLYFEAQMTTGQRLAFPELGDITINELAIYVASGEVSLNGYALRPYSMVVLKLDEKVELQASSDARIAVIGGETLSKRYVEWNFVSSRKERIEQAKQDWLAGNFPVVPDDSEEYIPLPAQRANGNAD
jgi:redox-sensitive bicupin YhaK (pirin superfamily)